MRKEWYKKQLWEKKVFMGIPDGCRCVEKPRKIQLEDAENYLKQIALEAEEK